MDKKQCPESCPLKYNGCQTSEGFGDFRKRILFIAHRGDERVLQPALFGNKHEQAIIGTDSGKSLLEILNHCGLKIEDIRFTNILKCILAQDEKIPSVAYTCCETNLRSHIESINPRAIVAFGKPCFEYMFPENQGRNFLKETGEIYLYHNRPVLITPHLSKIYRLPKPDEAERIRRFLEE